MNKPKPKKNLIATMVGIMTVISCACTSMPNPAQSTSKEYIAVIVKSTDSAFWKSCFAGVNAAKTEYNLDISIEGPENEEDFETQNELIRKALKNDASAIVFSAVDYEANASAIDEAASQGVKIVIIDSGVNSTKPSCEIGTDNYEAGCEAGRAVLDMAMEEMHVGIVNYDINSENGQHRENGFRDTVAANPNTDIVETINVISDTEQAKQGTMNMIERNPQINVIVTFNEWTSLGVGYAIQELGLKDEVSVVAFDSNIVSVGMLETGEVDALIVQNPYAMGYQGVKYAYRLMHGEKIDKTLVDTGTTLVTKDNMYDEECQRVLFPFDEDGNQ